MNYIISQTIVIINGYFKFELGKAKTQLRFLFFKLMICLFDIVKYLLLGAFTGLMSIIVSIIRSSVYYGFKHHKKDVPIFIPILLNIVMIILTSYTYSGWWSLLPLAGSITCTWADWQPDLYSSKTGQIINESFWLIYKIMYSAWLDMIVTIIEIASCWHGLKESEPQPKKIVIYKGIRKEILLNAA